MEHITVGRKCNEGKVAFVECVKDGSLDDINIKDKCFLLVILTKGKLEFRVGGEKVTATAPSFLCFDELENPVLVSKSKAQYTCVYFHPKFLNINMTFELLRSKSYCDIATTHDMFMLKPFIDKAYVIPIVYLITNAALYNFLGYIFFPMSISFLCLIVFWIWELIVDIVKKFIRKRDMYE